MTSLSVNPRIVTTIRWITRVWSLLVFVTALLIFVALVFVIPAVMFLACRVMSRGERGIAGTG